MRRAPSADGRAPALVAPAPLTHLAVSLPGPKVRARFQSKDEGDAYLKSHPFNGSGACTFKMVYNRPRKQDKDGAQKPFHLSRTSVLLHSSCCSAVGKVKSRTLQGGAGFRAAGYCSDGKITRDGMDNAALVDGLGAVVPRTPS